MYHIIRNYFAYRRLGLCPADAWREAAEWVAFIGEENL